MRREGREAALGSACGVWCRGNAVFRSCGLGVWAMWCAIYCVLVAVFGVRVLIRGDTSSIHEIRTLRKRQLGVGLRHLWL